MATPSENEGFAAAAASSARRWMAAEAADSDRVSRRRLRIYLNMTLYSLTVTDGIVITKREIVMKGFNLIFDPYPLKRIERIQLD